MKRFAIQIVLFVASSIPAFAAPTAQDVFDLLNEQHEVGSNQTIQFLGGRPEFLVEGNLARVSNWDRPDHPPIEVSVYEYLAPEPFCEKIEEIRACNFLLQSRRATGFAGRYDLILTAISGKAFEVLPKMLFLREEDGQYRLAGDFSAVRPDGSIIVQNERAGCEEILKHDFTDNGGGYIVMIESCDGTGKIKTAYVSCRYRTLHQVTDAGDLFNDAIRISTPAERDAGRKSSLNETAAGLEFCKRWLDTRYK